MMVLLVFVSMLAVNGLWLLEVVDLKASMRRSLPQYWESIGSPDSFSLVDGLTFVFALYGRGLGAQEKPAWLAGRIGFARLAGVVVALWNAAGVFVVYVATKH